MAILAAKTAIAPPDYAMTKKNVSSIVKKIRACPALKRATIVPVITSVAPQGIATAIQLKANAFTVNDKHFSIFAISAKSEGFS